ncbi:MAG: hypothetical protein M0R68_06385 [Bacteroidetes bacterium]|nr:hypothetical protein [Bacteroidota bacterium]
MLHEILYTLHVLGMAGIIIISLQLALKKEITEVLRKKLSLFLMSAAHTQLLTGFALFFLLMSEVNHMKIGIKMLLAIEVAVLATMYRRSIAKNEVPNSMFIVAILLSAIVITLVAFFL